MARFRRMKTLQKFSSAMPLFTTISARSATSSAAKSTGRDAPRRWRRGRQSWPKARLGLVSCALLETSCRWTDSTQLSQANQDPQAFVLMEISYHMTLRLTMSQLGSQSRFGRIPPPNDGATDFPFGLDKE